MKLNFILAFVFLLSISISAQPQFVKDLGNPSTDPSNLSVAGQNLFFTTHNREFLAGFPGSSNSPATFNLLDKKIINYYSNFTAVGNKIFFRVNKNDYFDTKDMTQDFLYNELWMSDGTKENTKFVTKIYNISPNSRFKSIGGFLYYVSNYNIFKTDGTIDGTILLAKGDIDNTITFFTSINGKLIYATKRSEVTSLHEVDAAGKDSVYATFRNDVRIIEGNEEIFIEDNLLLFSWSLWKSKGADSTYKFYTNTKTYFDRSNGFLERIYINGDLYMIVFNMLLGNYELLKTNGTTTGTIRVKSELYNISNLTNVNGKLFFTSSTANSGTEIWVSNGTAESTKMIKDIMPGRMGSDPLNIVSLNGYAYFSANGPDGRELWRTDGTAANTVQIKDIYPGGTGSDPSNLKILNNVLYFTAHDGINGLELWRSNGSTSGTYIVKDFSRNSGVANLAGFKGKLYFSAEYLDSYLYRSDGTNEGTNVFDQYYSGYESIKPVFLTPGKDLLYYFYNGLNLELLSTKGDINTTNIVYIAEDFFREVNEAKTINDSIFFIWSKKNNYYLSMSDGTTAGTKMLNVASVTPPLSSFKMSQLTVFKNEMYLMLFGIQAGQYHGLWKVNKSTNQIEKVKDISIKSMPKQLTVVGNKLYFIAENETTGRELWISDGTEAGTMLLKDINPGISSSNITNITDWNGVAYFTANDGTYGDELWTSNGTPAGTHLVKDINTNGSSYIDLLTVSGNQLFFKARTAGSGLELFKSDGTETGTVLVKDINPTGSSNPEYLTDVNGILCFSALSSSGIELWRSDGTEEGTYLTGDIYPGPDYSSPSDLTNVDGTLYFVAYTPKYGRELYKYVLTTNSANRSGIIEKAASLEIYPNPAHETVTISEKNSDVKIQQIEILNLQGMVLEKKSNESNLNQYSIGHLKQGIYLLKIYNSDNTSETIKIVKQ